MATTSGSPKTPTVQAPGWTESGPYTKESNPLSVKYIKNNWYLPIGFLLQQSNFVPIKNPDGQLFVPQIRLPAHSESLSQSPSSAPHRFDELQQYHASSTHPSAVEKEKAKYFIIIVALNLVLLIWF